MKHPADPDPPSNKHHMTKTNKIVAVDFDGTCTTHEYPDIGADIGAQRVLERLVAEGHQIILWTMRSGDKLEEAVDWFQRNRIPLFGIQRNPTQDTWTDSPKAYAHLYIDDAALGCPLIHNRALAERPYVDWGWVETILEGQGFLPSTC